MKATGTIFYGWQILLLLGLIAFLTACEAQTSIPTSEPSTVSTGPLPVTDLEIPQTRTPDRRPTITSIPAGTQTPTLEPSITPTFPFYSLECGLGENTNRCYDTLLQIQFDYPISWHPITPNLERGADKGWEYRYLTLASTGDTRTLAGGVSRDYSEGRESTWFDFGKGDTSDEALSEICNGYSSDCFEVKTHVFFFIWPRVEDICSAGLTVYSWPPVGIVLIQLPGNNYINGLVFIDQIFSDAAASEIYTSLGPWENELFPTNCSETSLQPYNQNIQEINTGYFFEIYDAETTQNIHDLVNLARSIQIH